ncbi:TetR family transcriptional regulator [Neobacillus sp. Marseille-QA0830]
MYTATYDQITTKHYIIWGFMDLLESTNMELISVKDIVKKAGISRSTFYLHFKDKYQLMETVREQNTNKFLSFYENDHQEKESGSLIGTTTLKLCQHIHENRNFYKHELNEPEYVQSLSDALAQKLMNVYSDTGYAIFASYGTIGFLTHWAKNQFHMSPKEASQQLTKIGITDWTKFNTYI